MFYSDERRVDFEDDDDDFLEVLIERLYERYEDYDDVTDLVNRVLWIHRDMEILGAPLIPLTEDEMMGLRILTDETNRFEKYKLDQADKKWQTEDSQ